MIFLNLARTDFGDQNKTVKKNKIIKFKLKIKNGNKKNLTLSVKIA